MKRFELNRLWRGIRRRMDRQQQNRQILKMAIDIDLNSPVPEGEPVVFFNASTRLSGLSLNAAFALLSSWSLRLTGVPVVYYYCQRGMPLCVLGTNNNEVKTPPPCAECINQSGVLYSGGEAAAFDQPVDSELEEKLNHIPVLELATFRYHNVPLGELALPSVRWILRRYHLEDDAATRHVFKQYILGAWNIYISFSALLDRVYPRAVVVFNGMSYPEATARWVGRQRGIRVISHEVCMQPFSAFFTTGDATLRAIHIPDHFELTQMQNDQLDQYLNQRFKGNFRMAGVKFWSGMESLDDTFLTRAGQFKQIVSVFSNVIFDTSQSHANTIFPHMFAWLDAVSHIMRAHPETLFVLRAHPDEGRPGKESRESVAEWVKQSGILNNPNVVFVESNQRISSYDLIRRSKFVMIYNSTIGLEASLLNAAVLCAGRSRFTDYPTVFFPESRPLFDQMAEEFLQSEAIDVPEIFRENARRYMYYELYRASLPFETFLEEDPHWQGYTQLKHFTWEALLPENSPTMNTIYEGIILDKPFLFEN
jgi:hypothetical protein